MKTRRFGRTELQMPVFSCGGMRYQKSWSDDPLDSIPADNQENLEQTVLRALELGINHIETARGYGTSELQLGQLLPRLPREQMIVQTKVAPQETGKEFLETFERSMSLLKLDHVDLLGIHGINNADLLHKTLRKGGALDMARQLQREGRARHIGFSTHAPLPYIMEAIETGEFDYVNLHWYYVNEVNAPAIAAATRHDMGVFIISPSDKGGKLYAPPQKLVDLCQPLSPIQFNDLYCLSRPEIHTLSIGAARPSDFDEHIAALKHLDDQSALQETLGLIIRRIDAALCAELGPEWVAGWSQGIPGFEAIPGEIHVHEILRLWNYAKGLDMVDFAKMRYNLLGNGGHWFPGTNAAEFDEPALKAALAASPFADRIPDLLRQAHALLADAPKQRLSQGD